MNSERQIPRMTLGIFALTFVQTVALFTGRFVATPQLAWTIPILAASALILMLWRLRISPKALASRSQMSLTMSFVGIGISFWFNPGLHPWLPLADASIFERLLASMTFSIPWFVLQVFSALFLSLDPHKKYGRFLLQPSWLIPLTFLWAVGTGLTLTLPPGPLCDEGMVLFFEGGCDWGKSNIYFFAKLAMLSAVNIGLIVAMQHQTIRRRSLIPFFVTAAMLIAWNVGDTRCENYYAHPQGNLAQLVLEMSSFALLGLSWLRPVKDWDVSVKLWAIVTWNLCYVVLFYTLLEWFPHWSWGHTFMLCFAMLFIGVFIQVRFWRRILLQTMRGF